MSLTVSEIPEVGKKRGMGLGVGKEGGTVPSKKKHFTCKESKLAQQKISNVFKISVYSSLGSVWSVPD